MTSPSASADGGQNEGGGGPEPAPAGGDLQFDTIFNRRLPDENQEIPPNYGDVGGKSSYED